MFKWQVGEEIMQGNIYKFTSNKSATETLIEEHRLMQEALRVLLDARKLKSTTATWHIYREQKDDGWRLANDVINMIDGK